MHKERNLMCRCLSVYKTCLCCNNQLPGTGRGNKRILQVQVQPGQPSDSVRPWAQFPLWKAVGVVSGVEGTKIIERLAV